MVLIGMESILTLFIVFSAILAALAGIVVLESFFHDKLKELFSDTNYFIFFFLTTGYLLYSIGEISFYLSNVLFGSVSITGIYDVYWSGGAVLILISFLALTIKLFKHYYDYTKLIALLVIGVVLLSVVIYLLWGITLGGAGNFFSYFYPIISALIVIFAFNVVLFFSQLKDFHPALLLFFLASCGILLGDILFTYIITQGIYGFSGLLSDVFYLFGYTLSFIAFVTLRLKMRTFNV